MVSQAFDELLAATGEAVLPLAGALKVAYTTKLGNGGWGWAKIEVAECVVQKSIVDHWPTVNPGDAINQTFVDDYVAAAMKDIVAWGAEKVELFLM